MSSESPFFTVSAQEFFHDKVKLAVEKHNISLNDDVQFYIVNLLCDFIDPSKMMPERGQSGNILDMPLAMMLKDAVESPFPSQKFKIFKKLGDTSLYVSGFFQDYFNRKCFDIDYFITMGRNAYGHLSSSFKEKNSEDQFIDLYSKLSEKFNDLVEVVAEVSDMHAVNNPSNILSIYDRWTKTQSDRLRKLLEENGITPIPVNLKKVQ